jgi:membrane protein
MSIRRFVARKSSVASRRGACEAQATNPQETTMEHTHPEDEAYPDGHGRSATRPSEIPARGWKDVLWRVYQEIGDDRVLLVAAGVTFYLLLAFVPALAAFVSLYGFFADPATISEHMDMLQGLVPGGGMDIIEEQLKRLSEQGQTTLGVTSLISILISLWSANAGVKSLFEAMNVAYDEEEKRSFFKLNLVSLAFTIGTITVILLFLGAALVVPALLEGLGESAELLIRVGSMVALAILLTVALAALYRWGPSRERAKWRWITPGAVVTIIVTIAASALFSWYVANFGSYNATYGSLGTVVGFMTWIWITMIILIAGAELNSETEHQTARDSTTGPARPMGARGAVMADRVGKRYGSRESAARQRRDRAGTDTAAPRALPRSEGLSLRRMAVALPAALAMSWMGQRRSKKPRV